MGKSDGKKGWEGLLYIVYTSGHIVVVGGGGCGKGMEGT